MSAMLTLAARELSPLAGRVSPPILQSRTAVFSSAIFTTLSLKPETSPLVHLSLPEGTRTVGEEFAAFHAFTKDCVKPPGIGRCCRRKGTDHRLVSCANEKGVCGQREVVVPNNTNLRQEQEGQAHIVLQSAESLSRNLVGLHTGAPNLLLKRCVLPYCG